MFDPEVAALLQTLNTGFPDVSTMTGPEARAAVAARQIPAAPLEGVHATDGVVPGADADLPVRIYRSRGGDGAPRPVVVFYHGGGFVFCSIASHDGFCQEMAAQTGAIVVSVGYRLAPEHKAPAAARDADAALRWVCDNAAELGGDPQRVAVAGDSAGGNLAAVAALLARDRGLRLAGQILLYPVLDPACDTDSYRRYATGYFNTGAAMRWYWRQYLPDDGDLPEPSHLVAPPRAASHAGLAPAVVVVPRLDPLSAEADAYAETLARAGVPVVHRRYPGLFHGFITIAPLRAAQAARAVLWRDVRALLDTATTTREAR